MAAQIADLWGELEPAAGRTPVSILRQQAALLGEKTNGLVEATVRTSNVHGNFVHSFRLVVPVLEDYTYELFRIAHNVELYPVSVPDAKEPTQLKNQTEFESWLRSCLSSESTKRIISNLMGQAAA